MYDQQEIDTNLSKWSDPVSKPGSTPLRKPLNAGLSLSLNGTKCVSYIVNNVGLIFIAAWPKSGNNPVEKSNFLLV